MSKKVVKRKTLARCIADLEASVDVNVGRLASDAVTIFDLIKRVDYLTTTLNEMIANKSNAATGIEIVDSRTWMNEDKDDSIPRNDPIRIQVVMEPQAVPELATMNALVQVMDSFHSWSYTKDEEIRIAQWFNSKYG